MDGTGRTCLGCQAPLAPDTRFCTKCGRPAQLAAPDGTAPGSPAQPGSGDGAGFTVVTPTATAPPAAGLATPAAPGEGRPAGADWADRTVTQAPGPPSAHDRPSYGPGSREPRGFEPFRPYQPAAPAGSPGGGQPPLGPPPGPSQWPPRQPPRRHDRDRSGTPLALWIVLLAILLGGGTAAGLLLAHPFSHPSIRETASAATRPPTPAGAGTAPASPAASASASAPAVTEQQAANGVATMLSQSVSDRAAINSAYDDVLACDPAMASASQVFDDAASSRQRLIASLAALPGRATLPPALLSDLTKAWQASAAADRAFAQWATDELHGCTPNDTGSPAYRATITPDDNATRYKTAFVSLWNPIAARYNLTQYRQDQL